MGRQQGRGRDIRGGGEVLCVGELEGQRAQRATETPLLPSRREERRKTELRETIDRKANSDVCTCTGDTQLHALDAPKGTYREAATVTNNTTTT